MFDVEKLYDDACHLALHGCGCSYELYVQKLTKEIDRKAHHLPSDQATALKAYAEQKGDYASRHLITATMAAARTALITAAVRLVVKRRMLGMDSEDDDAARDLHQEIMAELEAEEEQIRLAEIAFRDAQVLGPAGCASRGMSS
ncbi:plasmid protein [Acetobacter ascendens]|uniref:Uncharacterized protein n=1 Tax=Acetobacter ascendens TaxID=481146 RepID=A0A1Y0V1A3_9PROT|nr:plasmid protein [Acetobacter ascendens]ARW11765.1 hypothetical protein S101447_02728 [Acetobacter ascendens]